MAKKLAYERYYWFHGQIRAGNYPNARRLAERFEISPKQAQRDIEFIRDRLNAPLVYNPNKKGYEYEDTGYELPPSDLPRRSPAGSLNRYGIKVRRFLGGRMVAYV